MRGREMGADSVTVKIGPSLPILQNMSFIEAGHNADRDRLAIELA